MEDKEWKAEENVAKENASVVDEGCQNIQVLCEISFQVNGEGQNVFWHQQCCKHLYQMPRRRLATERGYS